MAKVRVSKPSYDGKEFIITVKDGLSPIAPILDTYKFPTMSEAQRAYRHILVEYGQWI